jgi:hypothetical protein
MKMNEEEIKSALDGIVKQALAKGMKQPDATFRVRTAVEEYSIEVTYYTDEHDEKAGEYKWKWLHGATAREALSAARDFVASYPSIEERRRATFTRALAKTIELGKAQDIDVKILNPLVELMEKLSANAIEDRRTPVGKEIDDEIPF